MKRVKLESEVSPTTKKPHAPSTPAAAATSSPRVLPHDMHGVVVRILPPATPEGKKRRIIVRLDTSTSDAVSLHSQLIELGGEIPDDDALVLEFTEDLVSLSNEPLCVMDHPFTISRVAPIPYFNPREYRIVHTRSLELPILAGERVGIARQAQLGFAWCTWQQFDPKPFPYYYAPQNIAAKEGAVLSNSLIHESAARPAFHFKVTTS